MADKTLFSKIIDREIPSTIEYEDDDCIVIRDIAPQAPVHVLLIPKKPITRIAEIEPGDEILLGKMMAKIPQITQELGLNKGFRIIINNGPLGGEAVPHLHIHILGKRQMQWPPG